MEPDPIIQKFLKDPKRTEVLSWLRGGEGEIRTLGEYGTNEESLAFAEAIYRAGAREVYAVDMNPYAKQFVDGDEHYLNAGKLVVLLPDDPKDRKNVFRWEGRHARSLGFEGEKDVGQPYLFVMLD